MATKKEATSKQASQKKTTQSKKPAQNKKSTQTSTQKKSASTQKKPSTTQHKKVDEKAKETPKTSQKEPVVNKHVLIGVGIVAIIAIIGVAFALTQGNSETQSTTNVSQSGLSGVVATVNGEDIMGQEAAAIQQQLAVSGENITTQEAVEQAVRTRLLKQEVEEKGYMLSVEEVEQRLAKQLQSQGSTIEDFKAQVSAQQRSYNETIENFRFRFSVQTYFSEVVDSNITVTEQEINQYYQQYKQQAQAQGQNVSSLEEVRDRLVENVKQQKVSQARNQHIQSLVEQATIEYKY